MIEGIEIERLRGIHEGKLSGLTPLTVLVGPSGSGKSTILDALLIATSGSPGDAVGRVVRRRAELPAGAPWLFEKQAKDALIKLHGDDPFERVCALSWHGGSGRLTVTCTVELATERVRGTALWNTVFTSAENQYDFGWGGVEEVKNAIARVYARLIEPEPGANHAPLVRVYDAVFQQGRAAGLRTLLPAILEGAVGLRIGTYQEGTQDLPLLHIEFADHSVPVAGAGSGIYALVRLALELAAPPEGVVLVEEPESHQHPAVIAQSAKLLLATARRGVQVIVSTHSLELIDALVANADEEDLERLSVVRVMLDKGTLRSSRFSGPMVVTARRSMEEDLR